MLACSSSDHPPLLEEGPKGRPVERIPARGAAFQPHVCWVTPPTTYAADCGTVTTTAYSDGSSGAPVELAVAVIYSNGDAVAREPVVYLDGGPGAGSLMGLFGDSVPFTSVLEDHDLVLFDQRGTGFSSPKPDCDLSDSAIMSPDVAALDAGATDAGAKVPLLTQIARCRAQAASGIDLAMFRSAENAADAAAVQRALGYERVSLYGISYGTRYALTALRDHPAGISSVIIDSVVPLQVDLIGEQGANVYRAIHLIGAACSAQPPCAAMYGDVEAKELAALERLDATPPSVTLRDGSTVVVPASLAASLFITFMYSPETISLLPELVQEVTDQDYSALATLLSSQHLASPLIDTATYLSVTCADEVPFSSPDALDRNLAGVPPPWRRWVAPSSFFDICKIWGVPPSPPVENEAVASDVFALVTSGQFDPVTPPSYGALAARTLSRSRNVVFSGESHGSTIGTCGKNVVHAFLSDPSSPYDASCEKASRLSFQSLATPAPGAAIRFDTSGSRPTREVIETVRRRLPFPIWQ